MRLYSRERYSGTVAAVVYIIQCNKSGVQLMGADVLDGSCEVDYAI